MFKKIIFYTFAFFKFFKAVYLVSFRSKSFCKDKLAKWVLGFLDLDDCRIHVCQFQAMNKKSKSCNCGLIKNGLLEFKKNGN